MENVQIFRIALYCGFLTIDSLIANVKDMGVLQNTYLLEPKKFLR